MTDQQIIQGLRNRDEGMFKKFVDEYQQMVINVSYDFVHNKEDALDIAQEVFIKVYDSIDSFKARSKLSTWLYRIAVNQSLNFIRDKKRRNIFSSLDRLFDNSHASFAKNVQDDRGNAQERMESEEQKRMLYKFMDELPRKQKIAFTLKELEGLAYKEIAAIMEVSVNETGVLINRARKKLQKRLVAYFKKY